MSLDLALLACGVAAIIVGVYGSWRYERRLRAARWAAAELAKSRAHIEAQAASMIRHLEANPPDATTWFMVEHLRTQVARHNKIDAAVAKRLRDG